MEAYSIVIKGNKVSESGFKTLNASSVEVRNSFKIERHDAVTPDNVGVRMIELDIRWDYPWHKPVRDMASGLLKSPYNTANPNARIACAVSHYELWHKSATEDRTILVLEHDAVWKKKLDEGVTSSEKYDIIGINDPRGATRKSKQFHETVQSKEAEIQRAPVIDHELVPQGIAGNSAYIVKPTGAAKLINLVKSYGLWPNDAIMCRQLIRSLGVTRTYYTGVQGLPSTTST